MTLRPNARIEVGFVALCFMARTLAVLAAEPATVVRLIESLRAQGANVIYSSELVNPTLTAPAGDDTGDVWARTRTALAAHGLELRQIGPNRFIVTRQSATERTQQAQASAPGTTTAEGSTAEVSVYASRYELGRETIAEPKLLGANQIQATPGSRDDALRSVRAVPGIATNSSTRPYIRGSFVDDVLVRFDGVPLVDPFHLKNFQNLISAFDPEAVERIEIFSGGYPVRYGTRSGGIIDITPRSVDSGSQHTLGVSLLAYEAATVGKSESLPVDWLATVRHSISDVVLKPVNGHEGEPQFIDTLGRVRWHLDDDSALTFGWLLLDDEIELTSRSLDEVARARYRDEYGWIAFEIAPSGRWASRTVLSGTWADRTRAGSLEAPGIASEMLEEEREFAIAEIQSLWSYRSGKDASWELGIEATQASADLTYRRTGGFTDAAALAFSRPTGNALVSAIDPSASTYAASVAHRRRWSQVEAEFGLRLDAQKYMSERFHSQLSPRLNVRYDFADHWRAYASWGRFTQAQRVDEWRSEGGQVLPDSPALAIHSVLGMSYETPRAWRVSLELYRKHWSDVRPYYDNLLTTLSLLPDLQPDRRLIVPGSSEASGAELTARRVLSEAFEVWGGYTYSRVADDLNGADDVPRSWNQPHALSAGASWNGGRWRTALLLSWHSGWPHTGFDASATAPPFVSDAPGARNRERWGNYFTADLSASWTYPLPRSELAVWFDLTNATDRQNACCVHLLSPQTGHFQPRTEANSWMGRTLNIGVTWRLSQPGSR